MSLIRINILSKQEMRT